MGDYLRGRRRGRPVKLEQVVTRDHLLDQRPPELTGLDVVPIHEQMDPQCPVGALAAPNDVLVIVGV